MIIIITIIIIIIITIIIILIIIIIIIIIMHTFQFCQYHREANGEHSYLPKKAGIFPV